MTAVKIRVLVLPLADLKSVDDLTPFHYCCYKMAWMVLPKV